MTDTMWTIVECFGVATGLIYLYLEFLQKRAMWIISIINATTYIFVYAYAKLYADMAFYVYTVAISCYGLFLWRKSLSGNERTTECIEYCNVTRRQMLQLASATLVLLVVISAMLRHFTDSPVPYLDALTTALSIIASWMTAHRLLQHWIVWAAVNTISIPLYVMREISLTALLFAVYAVASLLGYLWWKRKGINIASGKD
jgi:nicotinamide mononucleotide transporter